MSSSSHSSWGLALSGGAAWGFANAGVIDVLEREELLPDFIAGSSMGAIVAALFATGHRSDDMRALMKAIKWTKLVTKSSRALHGGLHGGLLRQNLQGYLEPLLQDRTIGECEMPFVCLAGRVNEPIQWKRIVEKGFTTHAMKAVEPYVFPPETKVLDAVMASSAIPVLFSPHTIDSNEFVDLCNFGALPSRSLRSRYHPEIVIGTDTAPRHGIVRKILPGPWKEFLAASNASLEESRKACDLLIEPQPRAGYFRFDKAEEIMEDGKAATEKMVPRMKMILG